MANIVKKIKVRGIVQGVGFRPYVYNLAIKLNLKGYVNNDDRGVNILLSSTTLENIDTFIKTLKANPPKLSTINSIEIEDFETSKSFDDFSIIESENLNNKSTIISPDMAVCEDCINDINDENNFRFNYALTNCTNCGPRYSIIKTVPYDRCNTSMNEFILCEDCKKEYENPTNRRYHAQPLACEKCGPQVMLYDKNKNLIGSNIKAIKEIALKIEEGKIVAIKGMGGFHIVCDSTNNEAVKNLRERKNRPTKPFALMFKDLEEVKKYSNISQKESELLNSKEKPIVIVYNNQDNNLASNIAPNINRLGCMIAYTPLQVLLFKYLKNPIIATSANLKGEPIIKSSEEVFKKLSNVVDFVLDFNRDIVNANDDSISQIVNDDLQLLRSGRGFSPLSINFEKSFSKKVLALGANQKSSISIGFENIGISSPYIGDLDSILSIEFLKQNIETFHRFYDFEPEVIVCDKHPNYESSKLAKAMCEEKGIELVQIQHHYAHVLSTMAEYNLDEKVLAFAFDGTGFGDDGNIWGGEVFIATKSDFKRVHHLKYFKLLGGEKAVKEPKRVALALLFENFSLDEVLNMQNSVTNQFTQKEIEMLHKMWEKGLNTPKTSSLGRLFDAISSFANILHTQTYEGETGFQIEKYYDSSIKEAYLYKLKDEIIDFSYAIDEILQDNDKTTICSKFINMISNIIVEISKEYDLKVILTGGVFQNRVLLENVTNRLKELNKEFYFNKSSCINDQGISLGQIYFTL